MKSTRMSGLAVLIALSVICNLANAQNETGTRPINKDAFKRLGFWYDNSTNRYHTQYPIIRSLPPLNSAMPWDILGAYVYMDSLARFDRTNLAIATLNRLSTERTVTDTLKATAKYLYKLVDYNPVLYTQYLDEVALKHGTRYWGDLRGIASRVSGTLFDALPETSSRVAFLALLETSHILRVKVISIDSMPTSNTSSESQQYYRVNATVLDTLKGQVLQTCNNEYSAKDVHRNPSSLSSQPGCVQFVYLSNNYFNPRYVMADEPRLYSARDPEFAVGPDSMFAMRPGQEAVVFIRYTDGLVDSTHDYYHLRLEPRASFGALPIVNGQVKDINHIWSNNLLLDYSDWRSYFMALRDELLSGNY